MIKLKDICIDLEYAKKLKELGVFQDSIFYWAKKNNKQDFVIASPIVMKNICLSNEKNNYKWFSAFTSTELLEGMPDNIENDKFKEKFYSLQINVDGVDDPEEPTEYHVQYFSTTGNFALVKDIIQEDKLCNALAKMKIYLIENKLMEIK